MRKLTPEECAKDSDSERVVSDACYKNTSSSHEAEEVNRGFNLKASDIREMKRPEAVEVNLDQVCFEETEAIPCLEESHTFKEGKDCASRVIYKENWRK